MKKLLSLLVVLVLLVSALPCSADSSTVKVHLDSLEKLTLVDKIEFDFTVDSSFEGIITNEVADTGKTVNGKLEHYISGNKDYYILTLKGNIDTILFWNVNYRTLDSSNKLSSNIPLSFTSCNRVENGTMLTYDSNKIQPDTIFLKSEFKKSDLKEVLIKCIPFSQNIVIDNSMSNAAECEKISYEAVNSSDNNLTVEFQEKDKEAVIKEQIKENEKYDIEEQDPERYVTTVKGPRNDGKVYDYKITFAAEVPLDTFRANADWFKGLGDNVTATLVGFTQTLDGKEIRNYTMIRFTGSKDTIWFNNADTIPDNSDSKYIVVDNSYVSLISFDGKERVYNSVNHETLDTQITFNNDNDMELVSIKIIVGSKLISVESNNIKYIGGGKATYEKLF